MTPKEIARGKYQKGEGILGKVMQYGVPMVIPDIGAEPQFLDRTQSRGDVRSEAVAFIAVPIKAGGETIGVLSVDRLFAERVSFEEDVRVLSIVASLIGQAVNLQLRVMREREGLLEQTRSLQQELRARYRLDSIVGQSKRMREIYDAVQQVSHSRATVLLRGESGTGKELIARAIHYNSGRRGKFVSINCGALPETLLESELFGHERGAFTGAIREKRGLFTEADRGTIFLDEIGETSTGMQIKLLRVLQDRIVRRVGSNVETAVDARVIAATNRDLADSIHKGTFREDLFYRINVIPITLPPLRLRRDDIPLLVDHFIDKFCGNLGVPKKRISADAMRAVEKYHWPGNVRELENVVERMIALETSEVLTTKSLPEHILLGGSVPEVTFDLPNEGMSLELHLESIAKIFMLKALERTGGVQTQAAELLQMSFRSFRYYAKKYDLLPRESRQEDVLEVENEK
jgi:Nif-specific regulatory protein